MCAPQRNRVPCAVLPGKLSGPLVLPLVRSCLQKSCCKQTPVCCVLLLLTRCVWGPCRDAFGIEKSYRMPCPVLIHDDWAVAATPYHLHPK